MITTYGNVIRDDAYGADTDSPDTWRDNFFPKTRECDLARDKYNEFMYEVLDDIADGFHLDTSEWGAEDYEDFKEIVGL